MPSSTQTFYSASTSYASSITAEFGLMEFTGLNNGGAGSGIGFWQTNEKTGTTSGSPNQLTPTGSIPSQYLTSLIVMVLSASGSGLSVPSGFTTAFTASQATDSLISYNLAGAVNSQTTVTYGGTSSLWVTGAGGWAGLPLTVSVVSPNNGTTAGGTPVTISGTQFVTGATVKFGSTAATSVVVVNSTTITCISPPHSAGNVAVSVTISSTTVSLSSAYDYVASSSGAPYSFGYLFGF